MSEPTRFRTRQVALTGVDIGHFSDLLAMAYPEARYYMKPTHRQTNHLYRPGNGPLRSHPPRLFIHASLARIWKIARRWQSDVRMILDPGWSPVWYRWKGDPENEHWSFWPARHPQVLFQGVEGIRQYRLSIDGVALGVLSVSCNPVMKTHFLFAGRFFRLLNRIATNRGFEEIRYDTGEVTDRFVDRAAWAWVGHDARRWAQENPARYAALNLNCGLRVIQFI